MLLLQPPEEKPPPQQDGPLMTFEGTLLDTSLPSSEHHRLLSEMNWSFCLLKGLLLLEQTDNILMLLTVLLLLLMSLPVSQNSGAAQAARAT